MSQAYHTLGFGWLQIIMSEIQAPVVLKMQDTIISLWATVHGLASIATMKNVHYDKDWETKKLKQFRLNHLREGWYVLC